MRFAIETVREAALAVLEKDHGSDVAQRAIEPLLWADMAGIVSQGLSKMTGTTPLQSITVQHPVEVERETPVSQLLRAGANPAPYVAQLATDSAIEKAKASGVGIVGVHGCYTSNGAQAFYVNRMAEAGLVGFMCSQSPNQVAPFGVKSALFGTNPLAFGIPSLTDPVLFDAATSAMTWYELILKAADGSDVLEGAAIDAEGLLTTTPAAALDGALLSRGDSPFGAGLGLVVHLLAGAFVGAPFGTEWKSEWGALLIALDPGMFSDEQTFRSRCTTVIDAIKQAPKRPGVDAVRVPGERTLQTLRESEALGTVELHPSVVAVLGL